MLLAFPFGSVGAHRFYLKGRRNFWAWSQVLAMILGVISVTLLWSTQRAGVPGQACAMIGGASMLAGYPSALVYGLRPDEKWNAQFSPDDAPTHSGWSVVLLSILTLMIGTGLLVAGLVVTFQTYFETQVQVAKELSQQSKRAALALVSRFSRFDGTRGRLELRGVKHPSVVVVIAEAEPVCGLVETLPQQIGSNASVTHARGKIRLVILPVV